MTDLDAVFLLLGMFLPWIAVYQLGFIMGKKKALHNMNSESGNQ